MGIKRLAKKTSDPSIPKPIGDVEICKEVAVTNTPAVASTPVAAPVTQLSAPIPGTPMSNPGPAVSSSPMSNPAVSSGPILAEPGKRLRRKMSALPSCLSTESLQQSPRYGEPMGSPGSPESRGFPARRRSIASPARQRPFGQAVPESASEGKEQMLQIVAVGGVITKKERMRKSTKSDSASSDSSSCSSASSSSSSSGSSSCDESEGKPCFDLTCIYKEGQRFPTPAVSDTARDFFMTLIEENPESRVATAWLVERGVLPQAKHNQILKKYILHKELMRQAKEKELKTSTKEMSKELMREAKALPKRQFGSKIGKLRNRPVRTAFKKR